MPHRREVKFSLRCTPEERTEWHALAAEKGIDLSEYIRHMLQNRAALARNGKVDLRHMNDDELVIAHRLMTSEAVQRLERLRRGAGETSAMVAVIANGLLF